jgi:PKD repeat protein
MTWLSSTAVAGLRHAVLALLTIAWLCHGTGTAIQAGQATDGGSVAQREVLLPSGRNIRVVVVEFLHHAAIASDGRNVAVVSRNQQYMPLRVLQLGPGDFCRLAFQTAPAQVAYQIVYGGPPVPQDTIPAWSYHEGLLLETREYRECDLDRLESVQAAFQASKPIGADYVDGVMHACNPFALAPDAFLSRYSGTLHIASAEAYGFYLATQDCSFLLIDGKLVASAPGRHPPLRHARPQARTEVPLTPGPHTFEFYHAAAGREAMMALLWEPGPAARSKPERIPADAWNSIAIARLPVEPMSTRETRFLPDFFCRMEGDVPLPDNDLAMVRVAFKDNSAKALTWNSRVLWEFGDGLSSEEPEPTHIYLKPGLYTVKLTVSRQPKSVSTANRIYVDRPQILERNPKLDTLDDYLPALAKYDAAALDAESLRQLVAALEAQAAKLEAPPEPDGTVSNRPRRRRMKEAEAEPSTAAELTAEEATARRTEALRCLTAAVDAGKVAFTDRSSAQGDEALATLARAIGPLARDRLGDSETALAIYEGGVRKIRAPEPRVECAVAAADVAINDLGDLPRAKTLLDGSKAILGDSPRGRVASDLARVWGDYCAATGDGPGAREAYQQAERALVSGKSLIAQNAWRGAHNRTVEEYLQAYEFDRAAPEIHAWEREFPGEKIEGQITYMYARYWAGRERYALAIALSNQLLTVNPESPYADQILMLAALCEAKRGNAKAAGATLAALVKDYPGSPLVPQARQSLDRLAAGQALDPPVKKHRKRP